MTTHLEHDAFIIAYDRVVVDAEDIMAKIRGLGFEPRVVGPHDLEAASSGATGATDVPAPIASALAAARETSRLVFLDFYADWCAPCKVLEKKVLSAAEVRQALEAFDVVKVDTDRFPNAARYFEIVGLPTLVVVDGRGRERFRHAGSIGVEELAKALTEVARADE